MSDPVTNVEIEDVLSSIRRLVSEDTRPKAPPSAPEKPERLVLTPSQRVPDAEEAAATPSEETAVLLTEPTLVPEPAPVVPEPDAVSGLSSDNADEPEAAEPAQAAACEERNEELSAIGRLVEAQVARVFAETQEEDGALAAPEAVEVTAPALAEAGAGENAENAAEIAAEETEEPSSQAGSADDDGGLARKIAELEAMISRGFGNFDADEPEEEGANAAFVHHPREPLAWEDHFADAFEPAEPEPSEATVLRGPPWRGEPERAPRAQAPVSTPEPERGATDLPTTIDEDMLREMVAGIVRQELQGALGERITRNVRKLVRREIHRMLESKGFD
ncbi:hypothetical protein [Salipiger abyssi]|uniref:hypothetical protein n=1 Tax=Salipiger abyssi TaxID=1250539 RepID=UPI001A903E20|nr:hypothetical protein [Salipiger abyssi]MBN9885836.1 hypothetical protein [Salipiger abyssi]